MLSYQTLLHIVQTIRRDTETLQRILSHEMDIMPDDKLSQIQIILEKHQKTINEVDNLIRHIQLNKTDINSTHYES